jgi:hypothetical protein
MEDEFDLDNVVIFELPAIEHVDAFCARFRSRWEGWSDADGEGWLFTARLDGNDAVATLLREAQDLAGELGLTAIRFSLDGRIYVLEPARVQAAALAPESA